MRRECPIPTPHRSLIVTARIRAHGGEVRMHFRPGGPVTASRPGAGGCDRWPVLRLHSLAPRARPRRKGGRPRNASALAREPAGTGGRVPRERRIEPCRQMRYEGRANTSQGPVVGSPAEYNNPYQGRES